MPQTYSSKINNELDQQTRLLINELEQSTKQNSGGLFDQFLQNDNISYMELYTDNGQQVNLPTNIKVNAGAGMASEMAGSASENTPVLSSSYYFSFYKDNARYMLVVYGSAAQVAELQQSFLRVLPMLLCVILAVALAASWLYSRMITKPVLEISRISKQMSNLELEWRLDEHRTDELGVLEKSLNTLSQNLSTALSSLQNANKQLTADIEHEKKLEQARIDFFSAVSHELKTPITVIKGQLEGMLLGVGAYQDHQKYLERSLEVTNTLETMVQEILTISRLETTTDLKKETFDCAPIIQHYLSETEDFIIQKELQIQDNIPSSTFLFGNKMLMEKVFSNLIGNALKYAPQGGEIQIVAKREQQKFLFSIENTGNIENEHISKLFDAFYRVEQSRSRKTGGSGLGLYIVQKILEQHGSVCHVFNTPTGVRFSFELET